MLNAGFQPVRTRHSAHPSLVPFQAFEASDGWMIVGCAKEKFWTRLSAVVGHPEWGEESSPYGSFAKRSERKDELIAQLEDIFRTRTVDEWLPQFYAASIPCGPINDVEAALKEEHTAARNLIVKTDHPRYGTLEQMASPVRVGAVLPEYRRAPQRNEDFDHVMGELLGLDEAAVRGYADRGAFGREAQAAADTVDTAEAEAATR
jgi:crotonobetainyl-CoA:carnitine CoA-transferase CaiB-like acyl-CoA transferase